jgi:hypothetical protein
MNTIFIMVGTVVLICAVLIAVIVMNINSIEDEAEQDAGKHNEHDQRDYKDKDFDLFSKDVNLFSKDVDLCSTDSDTTGLKDQDIQGIDSRNYYTRSNEDNVKDNQVTLNVLKITVDRK